jgi:hypothetical protein
MTDMRVNRHLRLGIIASLILAAAWISGDGRTAPGADMGVYSHLRLGIVASLILVVAGFTGDGHMAPGAD